MKTKVLLLATALGLLTRLSWAGPDTIRMYFWNTTPNPVHFVLQNNGLDATLGPGDHQRYEMPVVPSKTPLIKVEEPDGSWKTFAVQNTVRYNFDWANGQILLLPR